MRRELERENVRLRQVLAEVRLHARVELRFRHVRAVPSTAKTLAAIASAVDSVLPAHAPTLRAPAQGREVG